MIKITLSTEDGKKKRIQGKNDKEVLDKLFGFVGDQTCWVHVSVKKQSDQEVDNGGKN